MVRDDLGNRMKESFHYLVKKIYIFYIHQN